MSHFFLIPTLKEYKKIDQHLPKLHSKKIKVAQFFDSQCNDFREN